MDAATRAGRGAPTRARATTPPSAAVTRRRTAEPQVGDRTCRDRRRCCTQITSRLDRDGRHRGLRGVQPEPELLPVAAGEVGHVDRLAAAWSSDSRSAAPASTRRRSRRRRCPAPARPGSAGRAPLQDVVHPAVPAAAPRRPRAPSRASGRTRSAAPRSPCQTSPLWQRLGVDPRARRVAADVVLEDAAAARERVDPAVRAAASSRRARLGSMRPLAVLIMQVTRSPLM